MLLLFDIDGTLIRSGGAGRLAMNRALVDILGVDGLLDGYPLSGRTDLEIVGHALDKHAVYSPEERHQRCQEVFARYLEWLPHTLKETDRYEILHGVQETLEWLVKQPYYVVALATGNQEEGAYSKLRYGQLDSYFAQGGFGNEAAVRSEMLLKALEKAKEAGHDRALKDVWVIGDTPHDITAARAAGMKVAAVATGGYDRDSLAEWTPDLLWNDMFEGLRWFQEQCPSTNATTQES